MTVETISPAADLAPLASTSNLDLASWLTSARDAQALAEMLVDSHFVPAAYKVQISQRSSAEELAQARAVAVANATGAILLGRSLGVDPLTALQQIYVVHGRPGMYSKFKVALAVAAGAQIWTESSTDDAVTVSGRAKGSERVETVTITMDQAKRAGWLSNANYAKTPQDMLYARAAGRVADRVAANVLFGIVSIEDVEPDEPARPASAPVTVEQIKQRAVQAAPVTPTPNMVGDPGGLTTNQRNDLMDRENGTAADDVDVTGSVELASLSQTRKIYATLRDLGAGEKPAGLAVISTLLEKPVESTKTLTAADASVLIERLVALAEKPEDERAAAVEFMVAGNDQLPMGDSGAEADRG